MCRRAARKRAKMRKKNRRARARSGGGAAARARMRSTAGGLPGSLRPVAELATLDDEDVVRRKLRLAGAPPIPPLPGLGLGILLEPVAALGHAGDAALEGPALLGHHEDVRVRVHVLEDLDQLTYFHLSSSALGVGSVRPVREDIQALLRGHLKL